MVITRTSMLTGKTRTADIDVTQEQLDAYAMGNMLIQDAFPHLSPAEREFILSGITQEEWDLAFGDDDD